MSAECVIGLQWGDEAKGKLVDLLTVGKAYVVRYQGGANAGHTVVVGDQTYKLHLVPSGILNPEVQNVVTAGVVVHPRTLVSEIDALAARGVDVGGRLWLSDRAHVVMPWHVWEDQAGEQEAGEESLGTTLRGIGPCYRDKVGRRHAFRLGDLLHENTWERMRRVAEIKCRWRDSLAAANRPMVDAEAIDPAAVVGEYREYAARLRPLIVDTTALLLDAVERDQSILLEGAQGALLDVDHGTYPFVTSSNSSGVGVSAGSGVPGRWISKVVGVAKCYSTRVGAGPLPTELTDETGEQIRQRGREYGTTTGRPRRCGWFDAVAVRYAARLSGVDTLALMMLDVLSGLPEIRAAVRYELRGREIDSFPSHIEDLSRVRPVYETWPGWQCDISGARSFEDLPREAAAYVTRISYWIGRPVEYISVGPERRQTIVCDQRALLAC